MINIFHKKQLLEPGFCFFDIDGVLNTESDWQFRYYFRKNLVKKFCEYCKKYNYEPVMISSWRTGFMGPDHFDNLPHIKKLEEEFKNNGITLKYKTPVLKSKSRDQEIERFLYYHPVSRYIIIDDDKNEYGTITDHNHFVNSKVGFQLS